MKKNVSLKLFCTVVWRGFCQAMKVLAKLFGYQGTDRYMKTVWKVTVGSFCTVATIFSALLLYAFVDEILMDEWYRYYKRITYKGEVSEKWLLSNNISFQKLCGRKERSKIVNLVTGEVTIKDVEHVTTSDSGDPLAVFFKDGKRGYLNRFTGEVAIPAKYSKAWVFSEGLAAVVEDGELKFIDHTGKTVISKGFEASVKDNCYLFKNGYCLIRDKASDMLGAIDTNGNWVIKPSFSYAYYKEDYILVTKGLSEGLYTKDLKVVLPLEYSDIFVDIAEKTILARKGIDAPKLYDFNMNILSDFVIDDITYMVYCTGEEITELDESGNKRTTSEYKVAGSNLYRVTTPDSKITYGLISKQGKRITPPIYDKIEAIGPDRYLCSPHGIVIDNHGNQI